MGHPIAVLSRRIDKNTVSEGEGLYHAPLRCRARVKQAAEKPLSSGKVPKEQAAGAKQAAEKGRLLGETREDRPSGPKGPADSARFMYGLKPVPFTEMSFSAACESP